MKQTSFEFPIPDGYELIFRSTITTKSGKVIKASWFGIKGFPILIPTAKAS